MGWQNQIKLCEEKQTRLKLLFNSMRSLRHFSCLQDARRSQ
ncbi:MAG: hypothetical protein RMX96_08100 [Nostoc sp. ChiSLP02]|nr:hypothetical protein [Nostoc sp. DedSLP05]MDZ8102607.1 hypothetical protein [Nostoc sp. DedSLP01]MDZ8184797.1 hypothetical protein [Nostoc sp. ChiSLP02]